MVHFGALFWKRLCNTAHDLAPLDKLSKGAFRPPFDARLVYRPGNFDTPEYEDDSMEAIREFIDSY